MKDTTSSPQKNEESLYRVRRTLIKMIKFIISLLFILKEKLEGIENMLPVSLVSSQSGLERELKKLGENISKLQCVGCKTKVDKEEIRGVYRHRGETFVYCSKFSCEHEAMHKMLS